MPGIFLREDGCVSVEANTEVIATEQTEATQQPKVDAKEERNRKLVDRWKQGYSMGELINEFSLSDSTIQNILAKHGFLISRSFDNTIYKSKNKPVEPSVSKELLIRKLKSYLSYYEDSISFKYSVKGNHKLRLELPDQSAKELFRELKDLGRIVDDSFIMEDSDLILEALF